MAALRFTNPQDAPALVSWSFRQPLKNIYFSSPSQFAVGPSQDLTQTIAFETSSILDPNQLMNLLQMTVKNQETGKPLLLNGVDVFEGDFANQGAKQPTPKQVLIAEKGESFLYLYFEKTGQYC